MPETLRRAVTENRERILQERHNLFMQEVGSRMVLSLLIAAGLPFFFPDTYGEMAFAVWFAMLTLIAGQSFFIVYFYNKNRNRESHRTRKWHRINVYMALIWALLWSSFPFLFLPDTDAITILTCLVILTVASSIPSVSMGVYPDIFISFITPVFLAYFAFILLHVPEAPGIIKAIPLINLLSLTIFSMFIHKSQISTIALRIEAEQASRLANKASQSKTRFLAAASHDLRQPLQAATLYAAMLKNSDTPQPEVVDKLDAAIASCNDLLNHLLLLSRLQSQRLTPQKRIISLADTLQPVLDENLPAIRNKGLKLVMEDIEQHYIFADAILLARIVRNLISNAVKYTRQGEICLSTEATGDSLQLHITDTGIGIDESYQSEVFEEFMQIDNDHRAIQNGLGLGLAIVSRLSALCDIPVAMTSTPGEGTRFTLTLSAAGGAPVQPDPDVEDMDQPFGDLTVLLIDDDKRVTDALAGLLESLGATVSAHQNLSPALAALRQTREAPSLIITDEQIGPGINAATVINAVGEMYDQPIPALVITGNTSPEFLAQLPDDIEVLFKPVGAEALTAKMATLLR
ncbi:two-component sensor protein [Alcanivorax nanhaiticus]|uniref:histidine kinase n=1 Tax=Alcanivorax nanhaiticus TaxID=1177154 RepID=A0A095URS8_9GAMM|nr:ATP-binding protein [Alcanivorax nanhaiticus]KGD65220.1 two-component sensor protein [Alcanivorax nanhaiticus]